MLNVSFFFLKKKQTNAQFKESCITSWIVNLGVLLYLSNKVLEEIVG